jgi:uncharacterized protein YuzE
MPDALHSSYDGEADAYYFRAECQYPSVKQIELGTRQVILDVDAYGRIIGVEVF